MQLAVWEFDADVLLLQHPTRMRPNYEPVVHVRGSYQSARVLSMWVIDDDGAKRPIDELVPGDSAVARLRFRTHPVFLSEGEQIVLREDAIRGVGRVMHLHETI